MTTLEGKVAVVTGAGRGIGKAVSLSLAKSGCRVVLAARSGDQLDEVPPVSGRWDLGSRGAARDLETQRGSRREVGASREEERSLAFGERELGAGGRAIHRDRVADAHADRAVSRIVQGVVVVVVAAIATPVGASGADRRAGGARREWLVARDAVVVVLEELARRVDGREDRRGEDVEEEKQRGGEGSGHLRQTTPASCLCPHGPGK